LPLDEDGLSYQPGRKPASMDWILLMARFG
jgi:hypothetical protein